MSKKSLVDSLFSYVRSEKKVDKGKENKWTKVNMSKVANSGLDVFPKTEPITVIPRVQSAITSNEKLNGSISKLKDQCRIEDSPYYVHRIAQTDRLDEFQKIFDKDPMRLYLRDTKNWLPIHYAASKNRLRILEFILVHTEASMINEVDSNFNTPLHIGVEYGCMESCKLLMNHKADITIKNKKTCTPIHLCIVLSKPEILDMLLNNGGITNIEGENGQTPLHLCALLDNAECAEVLVKHNADLTRSCPNGFFAIHLAATKNSTKVFKYLLSVGAERGCSKAKMLSFVDPDNNKPLHTAVQFSNTSAVELCLENGASIDECIEKDQSTAVHVACSQGSLDILKLMFEKQSDLKDIVINMQDINRMTPLHRACMFDHVDVVEYLIDCGADIDALDKERRSPLLLAATRNCTKVMCFLLKKEADIHVRDSKQRNFLHLVVSNQATSLRMLKESESLFSKCSLNLQNKNRGEDVMEIRTIGSTPERNRKDDDGGAVTVENFNEIAQELVKRPKFSDLYEEQDLDGCTVIHYASKLGHVASLKALIQFGASIATKNFEKQSAIHFAARYGRYNSCQQILSSGNFKNFINEKDVRGFTPLHLAAQNGHAKVVKLLMQKGAIIYKTYSGNTAFHEAAKNCHITCMHIIFSCDPTVIDSVNKDMDTALHIAAAENHTNAVEYLLNNNASFLRNNDGLTFIDLAIQKQSSNALFATISNERWEEALNLPSKLYKTPFLGIIEFSSECTQAVLERCITRKDVDGSNGKKYDIVYNFKYLNWSEEVVDRGKPRLEPMVPLQNMVQFGRTECLSHPLCETLLKRKWNKYGLPIYIARVGIYCIFLVMLTLICTTYPTCFHDDVYQYYSTNNNTHCYEIINDHDSIYYRFKNYHVHKILAIFCIVFSVGYILANFHEIYMKRLACLTDLQIYVQFITSIMTIAFVVPFLFVNSLLYHYQWEVGTIAIFATWFNLLLYMQRFYLFGIYVVMFTEILRTIVKVVFLFSILIVAFALVFYILLQNEEIQSNSTPFISLLRTFTMLIGEIGALETFILPLTDNDPYTLHFEATSIIFILIFIVFVPILLTNLLIGLAVGDIETIQKTSKLKREAMQVFVHVELESKMPKFVYERLSENEFVIRHGEPPCEGTIFKRIYEKIQRWTASSNDTNHKTEPDDSLMYEELLKQKQRLGIMKTQMDQQTELLKLIVKKMQIKAEDEEDEDEVETTAGQRSFENFIPKQEKYWGTKSSSSRLKHLVLQRLMEAKDQFDDAKS